ncbi:Putative ribonuclease H protein At1g65750 [Linum perenne]
MGAGDIDGVILNTDGSVDPRIDRTSTGGLIRDNLGRCCSSVFTINLGRCSITRAELRVSLMGFHIAWSAGFRHIAVQSDSRVAISLIMDDGVPTHQHSGEVIIIREYLQREWDVTFSHVFREANKSADFLASLGHDRELGLHMIATLEFRL